MSSNSYQNDLIELSQVEALANADRTSNLVQVVHANCHHFHVELLGQHDQIGKVDSVFRVDALQIIETIVQMQIVPWNESETESELAEHDVKLKANKQILT